MAQILFIRHAQAQANLDRVLMGASLAVNSPLSEVGIGTAQQKAAQLKSIGFLPDNIFCSALERAKQTAQIISDELGSTAEIVEDSRFNERSFGQYEGQPYEAVLEAFEKYGDNPPTVEPVESFAKRVTDAFKYVKALNAERILIVTHSNPVMVMQMYVTDPDSLYRFWELGDPDYCEGYMYEF